MVPDLGWNIYIIYLEFLFIRKLYILPIYLFIYLFLLLSVWTHGYLRLWATRPLYQSTLVSCSNCSSSGAVLVDSGCHFDILPTMCFVLLFLRTSLFYGTTGCSRIILCFSSSRISHLSQALVVERC